MTDLKFNLLGILYHADPINPVRECELVNSGLATPAKIRNALSDLREKGFISSPIGSDVIEITSPGSDAYEAAEQERNQQTEQKRQQRFENKISVASVLIPLICFVLGLVVEYFGGIIVWITSLFS